VSVAWTVGGLQATISFTPGATGGSPITSYEVTTFPVQAGGTGTSSPITIYTSPNFAWPSNTVFRLYAYNACGYGNSGDYS
jgi:hypothetical protein